VMVIDFALGEDDERMTAFAQDVHRRADRREVGAFAIHGKGPGALEGKAVDPAAFEGFARGHEMEGQAVPLADRHQQARIGVIRMVGGNEQRLARPCQMGQRLLSARTNPSAVELAAQHPVSDHVQQRTEPGGALRRAEPVGLLWAEEVHAR